MAERMTIARIADAAGVSPPTVSKVVNGRSDVAPRTRERVERVLQEYGYKAQPAANTTSALIDVVVNAVDSAWVMEIIRGIGEVASANGLGVVVTAQDDYLAHGNSWLDAVASRRPAGLILAVSDLTAEQIGRLKARSIPLVVIDPTGEPAHGIPSVGATNYNGGVAATRHLLELGHRRIGMIGGPPSVMFSRARVDGYRAALETAGLEVDARLIRWGTFQVEAGYELGGELFELDAPPTAIFAGADLQAVGVYEAARVRGIEIPTQLSVVGFDDLPLARWLGPPLTTIRQPLNEMAAAATRLVLGHAGDERIELATSLVVRQSTGEI